MSFTTPKTYATGDPLTAAELNQYQRDNIVALKDPPSNSYIVNEGSDYATTTTSFVVIDATNLSLAITTTGGDVVIAFTGTVRQATSGESVAFEIFKDTDGGGFVAIAGNDGMMLVQATAAQANYPIVINWLLTGLAAGTHTFRIYWKVSAGTATLWAGAGTGAKDLHPIFWVREI